MWRSLCNFSLLRLGAVSVILVVLAGCMSDKDRILQVVEQERERCMSGEGEFHEVRLFDGERREILRQACQTALGEVEVADRLSATVAMGPYTWHAGQSGAWVLTGVKWDALEKAMRARVGDDVPVDLLEDAERHFAKAQQEYGDSVWLRLERLSNLLELREKTRKASTKEPHTIGESAHKHYEELLTWAESHNDVDAIVKAQIQVVRHLQKYRDRQKVAYDAVGSQDEWLEKSIELALKEGDRKQAEETRKELEKRQSEAEGNRQAVKSRIEATTEVVCAVISTMSTDGLKDANVRTEAESLKSGVNCGEAPEETADLLEP